MSSTFLPLTAAMSMWPFTSNHVVPHVVPQTPGTRKGSKGTWPLHTLARNSLEGTGSPGLWNERKVHAASVVWICGLTRCCMTRVAALQLLIGQKKHGEFSFAVSGGMRK